MSEHDAFDRVLAAVHAATLDETRWPATSALIDETCGLTGNGLMVGEGPKDDVRALFVGLYARGQRCATTLRYYRSTDATITTADTSVGIVKLAFVERAGTRDRDLNSSQAAIVTASQMRKERPRSSR